jgi:hypothetical protein
VGRNLPAYCQCLLRCLHDAVFLHLISEIKGLRRSYLLASSRIVWNPTFLYLFLKCQPLVVIHRQMDPVSISSSCICKTSSSFILTPVHRSSKFSLFFRFSYQTSSFPFMLHAPQISWLRLRLWYSCPLTASFACRRGCYNKWITVTGMEVEWLHSFAFRSSLVRAFSTKAESHYLRLSQRCS